MGVEKNETDCFLAFFISLLTEGVLLLRHTFQGFFIQCFRRNRIFTLVSRLLPFLKPTLLAVIWERMCGNHIHGPWKSWFKDEVEVKLSVDQDFSVKRSQSLVYDFLWPIASQTRRRRCVNILIYSFSSASSPSCIIRKYFVLFRFSSLSSTIRIIQHERKKYHLSFLPPLIFLSSVIVFAFP